MSRGLRGRDLGRIDRQIGVVGPCAQEAGRRSGPDGQGVEIGSLAFRHAKRLRHLNAAVAREDEESE